jgi:TrmH family RNA methyltransferase
MVLIKNVDDGRISLYKNLDSTPREHTEQGLFVAEGAKIVRKLLESPIEAVSVLMADKFAGEFVEIAEKSGLSGDKIFVADKKLLDKIVGFKIHSGILAMGRQPDMKIPEDLSGRIVFMCGIVNSENVGAIVRNCAAFGVENIIFDKETSSPYLRRAIRVSMGSVFHEKICFAENTLDTISELKSKGCKIFAVEIDEKMLDYSKADFPENTALIFGSEGRGINREILENCDMTIGIPMSGKIESINVAAASAVILSRIYSS